MINDLWQLIGLLQIAPWMELTTIGLFLIRLVLAVGHAVTCQAVVDTVTVATLKVIHTSAWYIQCWWGRNVSFKWQSNILMLKWLRTLSFSLLQAQVLSSRSCLSPRQLQLTRPSDVGRHRSWQPPLLIRQGENSPGECVTQGVKEAFLSAGHQVT